MKATTAAPPNALIVWFEDMHIMTQLPGPDHQPVVLRYPLTIRGLSDMLALIGTRRYDSVDTSYTPAKPYNPAAGTFAQQELAGEVLRRLGILG